MLVLRREGSTAGTPPVAVGPEVATTLSMASCPAAETTSVATGRVDMLPTELHTIQIKKLRDSGT